MANKENENEKNELFALRSCWTMCSVWQRWHFWRRERCFIHWSRGDVFGWRILFWRRHLHLKSVYYIILTNYMYIYYTYNNVSYTYFTLYVEVCVCFEIFRLTSGLCVFVCSCMFVFVCMCVCVCVCVCVWFMRTQMCIMTWIWQVFQGEGDLWGLIQSEFFGGESRKAVSCEG